MDFEFNPISKQVVYFVFIVASFMTSFGFYFLSLINERNYPFIIPCSIFFFPWLPFWVLVYLTSRVRFTKDKIIKSSFLGKREIRKDKVQFFGVVYRKRYSFRIIPPEKAMTFNIMGNCQIFISETPANQLDGTQTGTIEIPFQKEAYDKIKIWMDGVPATGA